MKSRPWIAAIIVLACVSFLAASEPYTSLNIGSPNPPGTRKQAIGGYDLTSGSGHIGGYADSFNYLYYPVRRSSSFDFQTRIEAIESAGPGAKAGIMARADVLEEALNYFVLVTPETRPARYGFQARVADFVPTASYLQADPIGSQVTYPDCWLRLTLTNGHLCALYGTNGSNWTQIGGVRVAPTNTYYIGPAVCGGDSNRNLALAKFRQIRQSSLTQAASILLSQSMSRTVFRSDSVALHAMAASAMPLNYQWFYNGQIIVSATSTNLQFTNAHASSAGIYHVEISNTNGTVRTLPMALEVIEPSNGILHERYTNVMGDSIGDLRSAPDFPLNPSSVEKLTNSFEVASNALQNVGGRIRGAITAPVTGDYLFWLACANSGELWLSCDTSPANAALIVSIPVPSGFREWRRYPIQQSQPIRLIAGRRYFLEALYKQGDSGGHCSVGWQVPAISRPTLERPIRFQRFELAAARQEGTALSQDGNFEFNVTGSTNGIYVLETSTNLLDWMPLVTNRAPFRFHDAETLQIDRRFYRSRPAP